MSKIMTAVPQRQREERGGEDKWWEEFRTACVCVFWGSFTHLNSQLFIRLPLFLFITSNYHSNVMQKELILIF